MFSYLLASFSLISSVFASCGHGLDFIHPFDVDGTVAIPSFSYGLSTGPLNWHNLNESYYLCGNGTNQSPILLNTTSTLAPSGSVQLNVPTAYNVTFENLGTNVEVIVNGTLRTANSTWNLAQFHFHTPSEHRVDLGHYEAEMHFVFSSSDGSGKAAVLGFFVAATANHSTPLLDNIFSFLDDVQAPGTTTQIPKIDFTAFEDQIKTFDYFSYTGSLTTPPCTEGVAWFLATTPIHLKVSTYISLRNTTKTNNRYTQNLLGQENILVLASAGL